MDFQSGCWWGRNFSGVNIPWVYRLRPRCSVFKDHIKPGYYQYHLEEIMIEALTLYMYYKIFMWPWPNQRTPVTAEHLVVPGIVGVCHPLIWTHRLLFLAPYLLIVHWNNIDCLFLKCTEYISSNAIVCCRNYLFYYVYNTVACTCRSTCRLSNLVGL